MTNVLRYLRAPAVNWTEAGSRTRDVASLVPRLRKSQHRPSRGLAALLPALLPPPPGPPPPSLHRHTPRHTPKRAVNMKLEHPPRIVGPSGESGGGRVCERGRRPMPWALPLCLPPTALPLAGQVGARRAIGGMVWVCKGYAARGAAAARRGPPRWQLLPARAKARARARGRAHSLASCRAARGRGQGSI